MASEKPVVLVFGVTGNQGGAVAEALLKQNKYVIKGVTRDPSTDKAKAVAEKGVQLVQADLDNSAQLHSTMCGVDYVFLVTNYWQPDVMSAYKEAAQAKRAADAAKASGVKLFIYSSLEDVRDVNDKLVPKLKPVEDNYVVPHFDGKGEAAKYMKEIGLPTTLVLMPFFFENFQSMLCPRKEDDGSYVLRINMYDKPLYACSVTEIGPIVSLILNNPTAHQGQTYGLSTSVMPLQEYMAELNKLFPKLSLRYENVSTEQFAQAVGGKAGLDLANMFSFYTNTNIFSRDIPKTMELNPDAKTFKQWVEYVGTSGFSGLQQ